MRVFRDRTCPCRGAGVCALVVAILAAAGCTGADPDRQPESPAQAEMTAVTSTAVGGAEGTMTLSGDDGATTTFGEAMGLDQLPPWVPLPQELAATGEGFQVITASGRVTGNLRIHMEAPADEALRAWGTVLAAAGFQVQEQISGEAGTAGFIVATGRSRRVHVSVAAAGDGSECDLQYSGD